MFSSLLLDDGPMTVFDIEALVRPPATVLLASCNSALADADSDELIGTTSALLRAGVADVVAPVAAVNDRQSALFTTSVHRGLSDGLPASTSLMRSRLGVDTADPSAYAVAAAFGTFS